jgi:hypothetical protein
MDLIRCHSAVIHRATEDPSAIRVKRFFVSGSAHRLV